ncbi:MAG: preprotein translocase subunit SecE [Actinobacteria bacterium]|nr:preprotein translocase subunit SecE [Actinomycetota bacterium]
MLQRQGSLDADGNPIGQSKAKKRPATPAPTASSNEERLGPIKWFRRYFREVAAEFRKVIFPSRDEVRSYSMIVLVFLVVTVALIGLIDFGLSHLVLKVFSR